MSNQLKKLFQVFTCFCIFSFIVLGLTFTKFEVHKVYADDDDNLCDNAGCFGVYENGICNQCDGFQSAKLTAGEYDLDETIETETVYEISNAGQLYWFADKVRYESNYYGSANAVLTADIEVNKNVLIEDGGNLTLNESIAGNFLDWTPIGGMVQNKTNPENYLMIKYNGNFDGQNHTISGLYFNNSAMDYVGLFGAVGNTNVTQKIKNVAVINSYFCGNEYVGGIIGHNNQSCTIDHCYTSTNILKANSKLGGIAGTSEGKIINCYNKSTLSGTSSVGGIAGELISARGIVETSLNLGNVVGTNYVGSVIGMRGTNSIITNSHYLKDSAFDGSVSQNGVGNSITGETTNDVSGEVFSQTETTLSSGEVTYALNNKISADTSVWGQNIDKGGNADLHPIFSEDIVYRNVDCDGVTLRNYSNTYQFKDHEYDATANQNKITADCKNCDKAFEITLNVPQESVYDKNNKQATISTAEEGLGLQINYTGNTNSGHYFSSTTAPINAGTYKASVTFNGVSAEASFTIAKATIESPKIKEKIYNGNEQIADIDVDSDIFKVEQNSGGVNVGEYDVILKLKYPSNYQWENSSSDELTVKLNIKSATNEWIISPFIQNWNIGETPIVQNGRPKFGQDVIIEYRPKDSTSESDFTTTQPTQAGEYFVRFTVKGTANYSSLTYSKYVVVTEVVNSGHIGSISEPTSRSPKNTPKGLPALAILGIVTLCVCAVFGIGIGIYHLVEKIKKDKKENKDKVK